MVDPDPNFYQLVGTAARTAGTPAFQGHLLTLVGQLVQQDYLWAVRYYKGAATDVLETRVIDERIVEEYKKTYHEDDPFGRFWRKTLTSGLVTFGQAMDQSSSSLRYQMEFQRRALIRDELGILLPMPGDTALGLFLESRSVYDQAQQQRLRDAVPMIEGLHFAHLGKLIAQSEWQSARLLDAGVFSPILIVDRTGQPVYKSRSWIEAEQLIPDLEAFTALAKHRASGVIESFRFSLGFQNLDSAFTMAPGGRIFIVEWYPVQGSDLSQSHFDTAAGMPMLTRLEKDILSLVQATRSTAEIAVALTISKETVKKYKLRLYRKFSVNSERQLVASLRDRSVDQRI